MFVLERKNFSCLQIETGELCDVPGGVSITPCPGLPCLHRQQMSVVRGACSKQKPSVLIPNTLIYCSHTSPGILPRKIKWNEMVEFKENHVLCISTLALYYCI